MSEHLFVYGSLLQNFSSGIANLLRQYSQVLGWGIIPGVLYDLGHYPGAVYKRDAKQTIAGQVLQLSQPSLMLPILDRYEGISDPPSKLDEYSRCLLPVKMDTQKFECWVYLYQLSVDHLRIIPHGDYLKYMEGNQKHLDFLDSV